MASAAVAAAHRRDWALVLASTVRVTRDLDVAEECVQDAFARALVVWARDGVPGNPGAWLTTVARRRAIDVARRRDVDLRRRTLLVTDDVEDAVPDESDAEDQRLRLIFTCCHPSLGIDAQVALSLRLLCGLSTADVARAFLVKEATMAARLTRAKKKIAVARIPYLVPEPAERRARVDAVLVVVHLLFTTGHTAPSGSQLTRDDLVERAVDLARMVHELVPNDAEASSLLALLLLTDARRTSRQDTDGQFLTLAEQDRDDWDIDAINEGVALVGAAIRAGRPGRFALMAAIAAVHSSARHWEETDWQEIVGLYDLLIATWPSPVVALNRAVAVSFASGPREGLRALDELSAEHELSTYPYFAAARADCHARLGDTVAALACFDEAAMMTENLVERHYLRRRMDELTPP